MVSSEGTEPESADSEALIDGFYKVRPNKSQIKRALKVIFDMAQELIALSEDQLRQVPLEEKLLTEIKLARRLNAGDSKKRQTQYVAKLMRSMDLKPIRSKLDSFENASKEQTAQIHRLESLREQLLNDDDALTKVLEHYEVADIQQFRNCIRAARKEQQHNAGKPDAEPKKKHYRELFQLLKTMTPKEK